MGWEETESHQVKPAVLAEMTLLCRELDLLQLLHIKAAAVWEGVRLVALLVPGEVVESDLLPVQPEHPVKAMQEAREVPVVVAVAAAAVLVE